MTISFKLWPLLVVSVVPPVWRCVPVEFSHSPPGVGSRAPPAQKFQSLVLYIHMCFVKMCVSVCESTSFCRRLSMSSSACFDRRFSISKRSVREEHAISAAFLFVSVCVCSGECYLLPVRAAAWALLCCWSAPASLQRSAAAGTLSGALSPPPGTHRNTAAWWWWFPNWLLLI